MRSAIAVVLLAASVFGIPSSLLEDVKIAKMMPDRSTTALKPKVKRSHEELMYGDQQNHFPIIDDFQNYERDLRFPRTNKRASNVPYYSAYPEQRMKRAPVKRRSLSRIRSKRDSDIDPRELLPVLLLALSEEKLGMLNKNRVPWNSYGSDLDDGEWTDSVDVNGQLGGFDDPRNGEEWLKGPVVPSFHQLDDIPPSRQWDFKDNDHKRFMVSKRYQNRDDSSIAQLFKNNQHWDYNVPVYRRMIL